MARTRSPRKPTSSKRRANSQPRIPVVVAAVGVATLVVIAAVLATRGDDNPDNDAVTATDPGVAHVHGLGINPADGSLYVATHHGTFRIPDGGEAIRLGESLQDTMGFTIVGPDHFLGSGHPDVAGMQAGQPGLLGLIESTDAGQSWKPVSLSGEVDFHGLVYTHDQIYGWDSTSGRFMVSSDRQTWDTRSTVDLYGFAVDPAGPDQILGAGGDGLIRSPDGGRTWQPEEGPVLVALTWTDTGIWGADVNGGIHHSPDGTTWRTQGDLPGPPQAILARNTALYAAAQEDEQTGIYRSDDQGQSWQLIYRDPTR